MRSSNAIPGPPSSSIRHHLMVMLSVAIILIGVCCCSRAGPLPTLVFFRSSTCPYCRQMTPLVEDIRKEYKGSLTVVFATVEEDEGRKLADDYGIIGFPVILLLNAEGERVSVLRGVVPQPTLKQAVQELIQAE